MAKSLISAERIEPNIYFIRGCRVMLDVDLAALYRVKTKVLNQAVRRNRKRFPADFMFELTGKESDHLRSQFVTSSWGGRRYFPCAFTEQGVAMLSSVLKSERAIQVNVAIIRAFVRLREMVSARKELALKLGELEQHVKAHDGQIQSIFAAIERLISAPEKPSPKIGFKP